MLEAKQVSPWYGHQGIDGMKVSVFAIVHIKVAIGNGV